MNVPQAKRSNEVFQVCSLPGGRFIKAAGPSDPRREAELDAKQDCLTEPLLDWIAEAISEGAMDCLREATLEATFEWTASSRFSACNLIASVWVDGMSLERRTKL